MTLPVVILLSIFGAIFLGLVGWLFWSVAKANHRNPRAKTGAMGGAPFVGGDGPPHERSGGGGGGFDAGGGGGDGGGGG